MGVPGLAQDLKPLLGDRQLCVGRVVKMQVVLLVAAYYSCKLFRVCHYTMAQPILDQDFAPCGLEKAQSSSLALSMVPSGLSSSNEAITAGYLCLLSSVKFPSDPLRADLEIDARGRRHFEENCACRNDDIGSLPSVVNIQR